VWAQVPVSAALVPGAALEPEQALVVPVLVLVAASAQVWVLVLVAVPESALVLEEAASVQALASVPVLAQEVALGAVAVPARAVVSGLVAAEELPPGSLASAPRSRRSPPCG